MDSGNPQNGAMKEDPSIRRMRREALVILAIWFLAATYTVGYCYLFGYHRPPDSLTFVWGFPDWIFWGILFPWGICFILSFWLAYLFVRDAPMAGGEEEEDDV
jgi:hypothetical protein